MGDLLVARRDRPRVAVPVVRARARPRAGRRRRRNERRDRVASAGGVMPGPHADHHCSRCDKTFDVAVGTLACPSCGKSKWFVRWFNGVNVSSRGISARKDPQLEAAYNQAMKPKEKLNDRQRGAPMLAVDI